MSGVTHTETDAYRASGFGNRMEWGDRPALLIIDVCKAYWEPTSPLFLGTQETNPAAAAVPDSIRRLLATARAEGIPVFHSQVEYVDPEMKDAGLFWGKSKVLDCWKKGDPRGLMEMMDGIEVGEGEGVVVKKYASAFFGTCLAGDLHIAGVDTLIICGVSTSGCVRASTLDAMQNGFRPMVVGTACGDRSPQIQNSNLFDLNAKYADVVSEEDALAKMKELAGWRAK